MADELVSLFSFFLPISLFCLSSNLSLCIMSRQRIPSINPDDPDVHAPASTYYTTGLNARQRTRTYTVSFHFISPLSRSMSIEKAHS